MGFLLGGSREKERERLLSTVHHLPCRAKEKGKISYDLVYISWYRNLCGFLWCCFEVNGKGKEKEARAKGKRRKGSRERKRIGKEAMGKGIVQEVSV